MNKKITDIVAYLTPVGLLIALVAGDREGSRFHLNQALVLALASIILNIVRHVPLVGWILSGLGGLLIFVLWCIALIDAIQGREKEIPLLGQIHLL